MSFQAAPVIAACDGFAPTTGQTVVCNANPPNPVTTGIHAVGGSSGVTIDIETGAVLNIVRSASENSGASVVGGSVIMNDGSISLTGSGSTGLNRGAGLVGTGNDNTITNNGSVSTTNQFNDGVAANGSGNTLINHGTITTTGPNAYGMTASWGQSGGGSPNNTLINTGSVTTNGSNARAASILGANGNVVNAGTLTATGNSAPTVYMQGSNAHLVNSGIIHARGGAAAGGTPSDGVFSNTLGSTFNATIENLAGGQIISDQGPAIRTLNGPTAITNAGLLDGGNGFAISGGSGNIGLTLQTGSKIVGTASGGGGSNAVTLQGEGLIDNAFSHFQTLTMTGSDWIWAGTADFHDNYIRSGVFRQQSDLTGNVTIASGASLLAGDGYHPSITPYPGGPVVTLVNAGTVDLTNGGSQTGNSLTVAGNYVGDNGRLLINTVLGDDSSASDKLVIDGGHASGSTTITVNNFGGRGAATVVDGILVVDAINGATTGNSAFSLSGGNITVGAYEYFLFRGGVSGGTGENWYLRSEYVAPVSTAGNPEPEAPVLAPPPADEPQPPILPPLPTTSNPTPTPPGSGETTGTPIPAPPNVGATPVAPITEAINGREVEVIPLLRPAVATYTAIPPAVQLVSLAMLGTFHERRGEQSALTPGSAFSAAWARVFGQNAEQTWSGDASPSIDGSTWGLQTGLDILRRESESGHRDTAGLYLGYATFSADVSGQAVGWNHVNTGTLDINASSFGVYWTHVSPSGWYLDSVLMGTRFRGGADSLGGSGIDIRGTGITASLESGYPIAIAKSWTLEPQAQVVWQRLPLNDQRDVISSVSFDTRGGWTGRVGARLQGHYETAQGLFQPYLKANIWHNFEATEPVQFDDDPMTASLKSTSLELGGGIVQTFSENVSAFIAAGYTFDVAGERKRVFEGNIGMTVRW